jgi:hypothetical protein
MGNCDWFPMSREEIRAWVGRHPEALPRTLADLAAYPMAFRSVMVAMVASDVRLSLAPNPAMRDWERRMATSFSREEVGRLFKEIGPPEPPGGAPLPADALATR